MTLREKVKAAEHLCRELADHLEQGFAPKTRSLNKLLVDQEEGVAVVTDRTLYNSVQTVLASDRFTREISGKLEAMIAGIDESVSEILLG